MDLEDDLYRIGTAAELSGVAVERLRAWERRYGLAPAFRSGRTRFYSKDQVARLTLIRQLIDQGHPVSSIVQLSDEQLRDRLQSVRTATSHPARVGLAGPNLLVLERQQEDITRIDVQARWANLDNLLEDQSGVDKLDILVVQFPVLVAAAAEQIRQVFPDTRVICLYQFATDQHLSMVQEAGFTTLKWPAKWAEIEHACATGAGMPLRAARTAPRRFDDDELIAIAASSDNPTSCPAHLVELITQLNAFADYAESCAINAAEDPDASAPRAPASPIRADASLYNRVHTDTTHARAQLELALEALAGAEQLLSTPN